MAIVINDIQKKYVRKFTTERNNVFYAVTVSVCRSMSSDGFVTFVTDDEHIDFENHKFVLYFNDDDERTFRITDANSNYTTALLRVSDVATSHVDAIEERRLEQEAQHLKELEKTLYNTKYFTLHIFDERGDKAYHSFKSKQDVYAEVKKQVFKYLDNDLNNDILKRQKGKYDLNIYIEDGDLVIQRVIYKRNAFADKHGGQEYTPLETKTMKYYVRNDSHARIIIWDWNELYEDIKLKQIENDGILNEERTEFEWKKAEEIARANLKSLHYNVMNLSKYHIEHHDSDEEVIEEPKKFGIFENVMNMAEPVEPALSPFKPLPSET